MSNLRYLESTFVFIFTSNRLSFSNIAKYSLLKCWSYLVNRPKPHYASHIYTVIIVIHIVRFWNFMVPFSTLLEDICIVVYYLYISSVVKAESCRFTLMVLGDSVCIFVLIGGIGEVLQAPICWIPLWIDKEFCLLDLLLAPIGFDWILRQYRESALTIDIESSQMVT